MDVAFWAAPPRISPLIAQDAGTWKYHGTKTLLDQMRELVRYWKLQEDCRLFTY